MSSTDQQGQQDAAATTDEQSPRVMPDLTPYAASRIVTAMLKKAEVTVWSAKVAAMVPLEVSSQVMYSRAKNGVVKSYRINGDGTWMMDGADFARWAKQYIAGYVNGTTQQSRTDYATLADEYTL